MSQPLSSLAAIVRLIRPGDSVDALRCRVLGEFMATGEETQRVLRAHIARAGLTVEGFQALAMLAAAKDNRATPGVLAAEIGITRASFSHVLARLEISQLIHRRRDVENRRMVQVDLTPLGRQALDLAMGACAEGVLQIARALDEASLRELMKSCGKVQKEVEELAS